MNVLESMQLFRRRLRRGLATLRHRAPLTGPVLFGNSFPKSGTHLLTQVLAGFARLGPAVVSGLPAIVMYDSATGELRSIATISAELDRLGPGDIAYGHLHALPETVDALTRAGVAPFFIYRDPRDVVVSHSHYLTHIETEHVHHAYYRSLPDDDSRIRTSILGRPELGGLFPNIRERFAPYLDWLERPEVCALKFREFIDDREAALRRVLDHAVARGFDSSLPADDAIRVLGAGIDPRRSPTYRSGKVGGWQGAFSAAHRALFKSVAGDLLIRLGYEEDDTW